MSKFKAITVSDTVGASALSAYQLCKTAGAAVVTAADTDVPDAGVIQDGADATSVAIFVRSGPTKAIASEAITAGARLMPAAAGKVAVHDGNAGEIDIGYAVSAASGDGAYLDIVLADNKPAR